MFVASQFGSFNVIYPVLNACLSKYNIGYIGVKDIDVDNLLYKKILTSDGIIDCGLLDEFDIFISGASPSSEIDYNIWKFARKMSKKSICILDAIKDYEDRFKKNNRYFFSDFICVMNKDDKGILSGLDTGKSKVVVTGSPYLSNIHKFCIAEDEKNAIRKNMLVEGKRVITFCTEYMVKMNEKERYGYDEMDILRDIVQYIEGRGKDKFKLFIKLHPNDSASFYEDFVSGIDRKVDCELIANDPGYRILQISDIVVGMTSIILAEASILGLNIVSYQPAANESRIYIGNEMIEKQIARSKDGLVKKFDAVFDNSNEKKINNSGTMKYNAIENIMALIRECLAVDNRKERFSNV